MPTVEQIWHHAMPPGTELIDGGTGIYGQVSWVVTLRPTPPSFDRLHGNELALFDTNVVKNLGTTLLSLVSSLSEQNISSLGITGDIPDDVISYVNARKIPLLKLPANTDLISLEGKITGLIREERDRLYQKEQDLTSVLMELALSGRGVNAILDKIQKNTQRTVVLLSVDYRPRTKVTDTVLNGVQQVLSQAFASRPQIITGVKISETFSCFISPVSVKQSIEGYLLVGARGDLEEFDRIIAKVGSMALAVELSRRQAVEDTEDKFQSEMLESLLNGELPLETINEKAGKLGLDPAVSYIVIAVQFTESSGIEMITRKAAVALGEKAVCYLHSDTLLVFHRIEPASTIDELRNLNRQVAKKLSGSFGAKLSTGMGRFYPGIKGLGLSYQEAEQALVLGKRLFGDGSVSFFGDLGIYRLLLSLNTKELQSYYQQSLGRLVDYDGKHGGELVHTLETILKYPTAMETSQVLHVHRNTLNYRIQRIQEITNLALDDGDNRLMLHLALKVSEVIHSS